MDEYWDNEDHHWVDESRCMVCKTQMGLSQDIVCSATCYDILALKQGELV